MTAKKQLLTTTERVKLRRELNVLGYKSLGLVGERTPEDEQRDRKRTAELMEMLYPS